MSQAMGLLMELLEDLESYEKIYKHHGSTSGVKANHLIPQVRCRLGLMAPKGRDEVGAEGRGGGNIYGVHSTLNSRCIYREGVYVIRAVERTRFDHI